MYTVDTALDALKKYDIRDIDLQEWERALSLDIPMDEYGRKQYSPHHINLFKNVKKHIALGRTINEIRQIISLPPINESKPQAQPPKQAQRTANSEAMTPPAKPVQAKVITKNTYASQPKAPTALRPTQPTEVPGAANVVNLVQRLTKEKDQLYKKLMETEKLNSHLYSANNLFHKKVKEMTLQIGQLREGMKENENFKLLSDKAQLHRQLITAEKKLQYKQDEIQTLQRQIEGLNEHIDRQDSRIDALTSGFDAGHFLGDWMETGHLVEVLYDNFGINIEPERVRLFRISEPPARIYGNTAVITTGYQYETNNLWKRNETLTVTYIDENTLEGELNAEYILDGVPVARALYRVSCRRSQ